MIGAILILDDNITMRQALTDILDSSAVTTFTAANGQEGLEILRQQLQNIARIIKNKYRYRSLMIGNHLSELKVLGSSNWIQ